MADIGVLPTRTALNITSSTGENGTIPGATPKSAGCMTAEQATQLDTLWRSAHLGGEAIVIEAPQRPADTVTRGELRTALAEMQRVVSANQPVALPAQAISDRIEQLERMVSAPAIPDASVMDRLAAIEAKQGAIVEQVRQLAGALDLVCGEVDRLSAGQSFIEKNALAAVDVKAITQ